MATIAQQIAQMVDLLPETDQTLALELVRKLVLAWDPDYTKTSPAEAAAREQAVRDMDAGDYVSDDEINWD